MVRLKSFLGCIKLETGGYIVGGIAIAYNLYTALLFVYYMTLLADDMDRYCISDFDLTDVRCSHELKSILLNSSAIFTDLCVVITNIVLIIGIKKRKHTFIIPTLITTVLSVLRAQRFFWYFELTTFIGGVIIYTAIIIYFFIVIYSLYATFRDEYKQKYVGAYQSPRYTNVELLNVNTQQLSQIQPNQPQNPVAQPMLTNYKP